MDSTNTAMPVDQYLCNCTIDSGPQLWMGENCEDDYNECASDPCANGICISYSAEFHCSVDSTSANDVNVIHGSEVSCTNGECTADLCCFVPTCANTDQRSTAFNCSNEAEDSVIIVDPDSVECSNGICTAETC
eukprot:SAG31_NODE_26332_length_444_cov_0.747826_1_plen_133_part_01